MTTTHPIPTSFRLRRRKWLVMRAKQSAGGKYAGITASASKRIVLYDVARDRARTPQEQQKTFWHESTHAVLRTMNHALAGNEPFVTQFALLLEELIRTARFDEEAP
jgi:hypothetical protein